MMENDSERRMRLLLDRLPKRIHGAVDWLRRPSSRWVRLPAGLALMIGGVFSILPILGLWMLPLGMMLVAQDIPIVQRLVDRILLWVERRHPKWLGLPADPPEQR